MLTAPVVLLGGYLLGSIPFGYLAGRLAGTDIRHAGSGNIGATNVLRVLGKRYGYMVFALDFLKGLVAVEMSMLIAPGGFTDWNSPQTFGVLAATSSVLGHMYPVWLGFNGGKGVATSAGALLALAPLGALIAAVIWFVIFRMTRYVSLASITAAVVLPFVIFLVNAPAQNNPKVLVYFSACVAAIVVWRHRSNLCRLFRGTESRFTRK